MPLKINAHGIEVQLEIKGCIPISDSEWCKCDYSFTSGGWLNYCGEDEELFQGYEVRELENLLTKLLNDELKQIETMQCMEPDFTFILTPKQDLRSGSKWNRIFKRHKIEDIYVEWQVHFWHEGLTDNFLSIWLTRKEIIALRDYLLSVIQTGKTV